MRLIFSIVTHFIQAGPVLKSGWEKEAQWFYFQGILSGPASLKCIAAMGPRSPGAAV